jgi:hypothetical protein
MCDWRRLQEGPEALADRTLEVGHRMAHPNGLMAWNFRFGFPIFD